MAQPLFRQLGNKTVPKLLEKINYTDIVNTFAGGTGVPASAELVKSLFTQTNTETADRINGDLSIIDNASADYSTLSKIENVIKSLKSSNTSDLQSSITTLQSLIVNEESARTLADNAIIASLNQEIADRTAAVSAEETSRIAAVDAEIAARETAINTEISARVSAINSLISALAQEVSDRKDADNAEALVRLTADNALQANIDAEILARQGAVSAEEAARIAADVSLDGLISLEKVERIADISNINSAIVMETSNRIAADSIHDLRMSALESGMATGAQLKGTVDTLADFNSFIEADQNEGWFYKVKTGTTGTSDMYMVASSYNNSYDYVPTGWTTKGFIWLMDFADVSNTVTIERNERILDVIEAEGKITLLDGKVDSNKSVTDAAIATLRTDVTNAEAVLKTKIATEVSDRQTAVENEAAARIADVSSLQSGLDAEVLARQNAIASEASTRNAADVSLSDSINSEVIARDAAVTAERNARILADSDEAAARLLADNTEKAARIEADTLLQSNLDAETAARIADVDAEESSRIAAVTGLNGRLNVIEGNNLTEGSVAKALLDAKKYADEYMPIPMLEGVDNSLLVVGDTVTLTYAPHRGLNGIALGECIVYLPNGDSVMVTVQNVVGNVVTLAALTSGEYSGCAVKIQYFFINADQNGAGMGLSGQDGAGL